MKKFRVCRALWKAEASHLLLSLNVQRKIWRLFISTLISTETFFDIFDRTTVVDPDRKLLASLGKILPSIADPDPGSGTFLNSGSGMGKKSGSGSGMNDPDHIFESLETIVMVKILNFFDADPGSGMETIRIRD